MEIQVFGLPLGSLVWNSIHSHLNLPVTRPSLPQTVADLWLPNSRIWNTELISEIFDNQASSTIIRTHTVPSNNNDMVRWKPAKKDVCSTKEVYKFLSSEVQVQNPHKGTRSVTQQALLILKRAWKHK